MIWVQNLPALPTPMLTSFSFGGGVQSTTIMALWSRVKREEPLEWQRALGWDQLLRSDDPQVKADLYLQGDAFMHPARLPLAEAVAAWEDERDRRATGGTPLFPEFNQWDQECSGLCGV